VDGVGVPLALVATGANRCDVSQLEVTPDSFQVERPDSFEIPQRVRLDKGYSGEPTLETVVLRGFIPHSKIRGEERIEKERRPENKTRHWIVEAAHSWMNRFLKILLRFEKLESSYLDLLMLACAFVAFRKTLVI
jgi:hypothetical protein